MKRADLERINATLLGDERRMAWSNLGWWQDGKHDYPSAARALAMQLATQMGLQAADSLLDVGCGYGASLALWAEQGMQHVIGVEPQAACIAAMGDSPPWQVWQTSMPYLSEHAQGQRFDAIIAIDAAYQWPVATWLQQAQTLLTPHGKLGFHTLVLTDNWLTQTPWQRWWVLRLLRVVGVKQPQTASQLHLTLHRHWQHVQVSDLSQPVLAGFAAHAQRLPHSPITFDRLKIQLTGRLCAYLHRCGWVHYVAVSARANDMP